jgi:hypothetical protein
MKGMKYFVITLFLTLSAFAAVMYSSCTKEACNGITCLNKGVCKAGRCICIEPQGIGGNSCEIVYKKIYAGTYVGITHGNPGHGDTTNTFIFKSGNDTANFSNMEIDWIDPSMIGGSVTLPAVLQSNAPGGSTFAIPKIYREF